MSRRVSNRKTYTYPVLYLDKERLNYNRHSKTNENKMLSMPVSNFSYYVHGKASDSTYSGDTETLLRLARQVDLDSAADSGYGHSSYGSSGYGKSDYYCPEGIPVETALFAVLAAAGLAFGILFMAITMITMGGRRKRGAANNDYNQNEAPFMYSVILSDIIWQGMCHYLYS